MKAMVYHGANDIRFEEKTPALKLSIRPMQSSKSLKPRFAVLTWVFGRVKP